jgi:hypothetical protein
MTLIVVAFLGVLLLLGIGILAMGMLTRPRDGASPQCGRCKHVNRRAAKFCSRCGQALRE